MISPFVTVEKKVHWGSEIKLNSLVCICMCLLHIDLRWYVPIANVFAAGMLENDPDPLLFQVFPEGVKHVLCIALRLSVCVYVCECACVSVCVCVCVCVHV